TTRTKLELDIRDLDALQELANILAPYAGGKSQLVARVPGENGGSIELSLGTGFQLDAQIAEMLDKVPGLENIHLGPAGLPGKARPNLRLVS
ncbi:MAG: hypothetical protein AAF067_10505, partial [Pseudomonadota bacterium]